MKIPAYYEMPPAYEIPEGGSGHPPLRRVYPFHPVTSGFNPQSEIRNQSFLLLAILRLRLLLCPFLLLRFHCQPRNAEHSHLMTVGGRRSRNLSAAPIPDAGKLPALLPETAQQKLRPPVCRRRSAFAGKLPALQLESAQADFVPLQPSVFPLRGIPDCRDNRRSSDVRCSSPLPSLLCPFCAICVPPVSSIQYPVSSIFRRRRFPLPAI